MSVGNNIRQKRKERGMLLKELADKIGLSAAQVSNIENGKRDTSNERMVQIAKALQCNVADLYDDDAKVHLDDAYIMFAKELKKDGVDPEQAKKWIKFAKKFIDEN